MNSTELWDRWMNSVGVGAGYILNVPPDSTGQIPDEWVTPAAELGHALRASWRAPLASLLTHNVTFPSCTSDHVNGALI